MKIRDILAQGNPTLSFEVFPPKTEDNYHTVEKAAKEIAKLKPAFMSVTYGAGGGTSDYTVGEIFPLKVCIVRLNDLYLEIMECSNHGWMANGVDGTNNHMGISVSDLDSALEQMKAKGFPPERIQQVLTNTSLISGKTFRSCRVRGYNDENIGLYEINNQTFYA